MASSSHSRLARLNLDLSELISSPYEGVSVHLDDANMYKFCLHLCPNSGPYKGLRLHFDVELPRTWPSQPPKVQSSASIDHPNVYGSWICCDLLKEPYELEAGYTGGYTPALTLRGLFMQFLTFFSSERVEQDYGYWVEMGEAFVETHSRGVGSAPILKRNSRWEHTCNESSTFSCKNCGYGFIFSHIYGADPTPGGREKLLAVRTSAPSGFVRSLVPSGVRSKAVLAKDLSQLQLSVATRKPSAVPAYMRPPSKCALLLLNDDALYEVLDALPSDSLINLCSAYTRAHDLSARFHMLLLRELRCFFLRKPLVECILGIGIAFDRQGRILSSEFDWLSEYAFNTFSVRMSIRKQDFEFFLPLAFSRAHFARAEPVIWQRLIAIDNVVRKTTARGRIPRAAPVQSVEVIYQFMNNIVLSLMKVTDTIMGGNGTNAPALVVASERAVISYCQLYHLLTSLAAKRPEVLRMATSKVRKFLDHPKFRSKAYVPDMGEFIVLASLVMGSKPIDGRKPITWNYDLNGPLLEEVFIRNVKWILQAHPDLEVPEIGLSEYRLQKTFQSVQTSLRLTMFQVAFLTTFVAPHLANPSRLADGYGFPVKFKPSDVAVEQQMVETIKGIYAVTSWPQFFEKVQFSRGLGWGYAKLSRVLRDCVKKSGAAGYHRPNKRVAALKDQRRREESEWQRMRPRKGMN